jgi:hypothetical protein
VPRAAKPSQTNGVFTSLEVDAELGGHGEWHRTPSHEDVGSHQNSSHQKSEASQEESNASGSREEPLVAFIPQTPAWQRSIKPIALVGGVTVTAFTGLHYLEPSQPYFEGSIQLLPERTSADDDGDRVDRVNASSAVSLPELSSPESSSQPSFSSSQHTQYLESVILPQALTDLQDEGVVLEQSRVLDSLKLQAHESGAVEIVFQANDSEIVGQVLQAIAHTYQVPVEDCQLQVCVNADYTQHQILQTQHTLDQLNADLQAFRDQHQWNDISQHHRAIEVKRRQFDHVRHELNHELSVAQRQLADQYATLGLELNDQQAQTLLAQSSQHSALIAEWNALDQQLVSDLTTPLDENVRAALIRDYEQVSERLYREIHRKVQDMHFYELDPKLWRAIVENPYRVNSIESWLNQVQRMQLLTMRRENLAEVAQHLEADYQRWRSLMNQHQSIEEQIRHTAQTLATYRERYALIQQHVGPAQLAWQVVTPVEVFQVANSLTSIRSILSDVFSSYSLRAANDQDLGKTQAIF